MDEPKKSFLNLLKSESDLIKSDQQSIKSYLEAEGYDYEKLSGEGQEVANKLFLRAAATAKRIELEQRLNQAKEMWLSIRSVPERKLESLQALFQKRHGDKYALNFRDLKNMSEDEAVNILTDLEILEFLEKNKS